MSGTSLEIYDSGKAIVPPGSQGKYVFDRAGIEQRFLHWKQTGEKAPYAPAKMDLDAVEDAKPTISADAPAQLLPKKKRSSLIFY
eukprot:CAMPEP_0179070812 /NCGR_PEP_ID=MMETSP0796-20121207/31211_1 /TAXON_ID=73915 /ORGANISM="Pyrodinium bahamense, Strain pbaha01" /LENGTH=84 /DNA_ID=CAMNT_0020767911 /DNA_START=76 /DNA_END=330 /DNA_ORIENTATION=+